MVKQHMSSIDVAAQVACLNQKLLGLRVSNIYDINAKTYVLKLSKSGEDGDKVFLVLESGVRFHTSQVLPDKSDIPSNFSLKLRKHVRTKRLESVRQLGVDRIVDFTFGSGEVAVHLILELYAQGNIVLADHKYEVLTLLRSHRDDDKGFAVMARHPYPMAHVRLRSRVRAKDVLSAAAAANPGTNLKGLVAQVVGYGPAIAEHVILDGGLDPYQEVVPGAPKAQGAAGGGKGDKGAKGGKKATQVAEDAEASQEQEEDADEEGDAEGAKAIPPAHEAPSSATTSTPTTTWSLPTDQLTALDDALGRLDAWFVGLETGAPPGFITCLPPGGKKKQRGKQAVAADSANGGEQPTGAATDEPVVFNEFHPIMMKQFQCLKVVEYPTFDAAIDEFFSKIAGQRAEMAKAEAEKSALSKLDKIRLDQTARAEALAREAEEAELRGTLIEYNLEAVDAVITALNQQLATGMDWHDLDRLIKEERKAGNPVAQYIHSLQLESNRATLLLMNQLDEDEEGDEAANARKAVKVPIDLGLTAFANAALHYDSRKKHIVKQAKTLAANEVALKAAEKKAQQQLQKVRATPTAGAVQRKPHWFERFHWFITSENYLVISGRDAQQNELIVKRYFKKGDVYVHAELHGASSTIIKNPRPEEPVSPLSLQQAGCACVCRSRAWDSKIVTSAWWVHHHQVSKTAPTGEYLPTGSFMIRGKKNFLPPQPLVFGFGFMFKLEPSCIANHQGERAVRLGADTDMLSVAMTHLDANDDEDVGDMDLGLPDVEEQDEDVEASALDRFMSGTYASRQTSNATALTRGALAAVGGTVTGADVAEQYQRYGLDVEGGDEEEPQESGQGSGAQAGRSRDGQGSRSRQEAAGKVKAAGAGVGKAAGGPGAGKSGTQAGQQGRPQVQTAQPQSKQQQNVRGKKGKQAKIKEKYADQDEEERELALALMASAGEKKSRADRRKERKERKDASRQAALGTLPGADSSRMAEAIAAATRKQFGGEAEGGSGSDTEGTGASEDGAAQTQTQTQAAGGIPETEPSAADGQGTQASQQGAEPVQPDEQGGQDEDLVEAAEEEEEEQAAVDEEREKLNVLDSLTGCPKPEDILLFAVPVCAPYNTLQSFKYKVKLTPGTVKKGKAARQAQELLSRATEASAREKELIKAVPDMDMINAMVGTVKVSMPGLAAKQTQMKAAKKSAAKAKNKE